MIRDWQLGANEWSGFEGGERYLQEDLYPHSYTVKHAFDVIQCFLLSHPGPSVAARGTESKSLQMRGGEQNFFISFIFTLTINVNSE